jgi:hypothetical protein
MALHSKMLNWQGRDLHYGRRDEQWQGMWRVRRADGSLTDMANLSWAKDAALAIAGQLGRIEDAA